MDGNIVKKCKIKCYIKFDINVAIKIPKQNCFVFFFFVYEKKMCYAGGTFWPSV